MKRHVVIQTGAQIERHARDARIGQFLGAAIAAGFTGTVYGNDYRAGRLWAWRLEVGAITSGATAHGHAVARSKSKMVGLIKSTGDRRSGRAVLMAAIENELGPLAFPVH